ncbi:LacI family DNA-binding transcriptional regulator [Defluviitalea phaphyphila]|uniref:LacI family DNA-binding transcriptional regulator n=1 Tax=Defluviitalea phaphyphila TaxID=1473580 RepID=UPI00073023B4|nr:LacI family DNA-binding transcriptional regulator [Defluviitalea phaphyphila]
MKKKVTIYDIAKELNLSPSTVSRALSNSTHRVNPKTKKLIEETARKMNYYPNTIARSLKTNNNYTIGVILPSISNPFYPSIVRGMEDEAILNNYSIHICSCDREEQRTDKYLETLIGNRVSGIITIYLDNMPKTLENFIQRGGKVLSIGTKGQPYPEYRNLGVICFNKVNEAYISTKHLLELGHRKIAMFLSPITNRIRKDKLEGYKRALAEYGITDYKKYLFVSENENLTDLDSVPDCNTGINCAKKMLATSKEVTGIVCMNDLVALGAMLVLKNNGYKVPKDYSIIGFDDTFFSNLIDPKITTLKINKYELGKKTVQLLLKMIENDTTKIFEDYSKNVNLIIRESTDIPRQN